MVKIIYDHPIKNAYIVDIVFDGDGTRRVLITKNELSDEDQYALFTDYLTMLWRAFQSHPREYVSLGLNCSVFPKANYRSRNPMSKPIVGFTTCKMVDGVVKKFELLKLNVGEVK